MFEKVSRSLKYDSNIFFDHKRIYIYMDTTVDHFTPLALHVRGKNLIRDNIEERKGYKMTYKELLYLLYFQRYEYFHTENHKKWLNSVGRCVLMVLTYLNTLGTHGASKKMIFFHF